MTGVYLTIDTEYAFGLAALGRAENFARSISCETPDGAAGIHYQMGLLDRHGLKGVFFVDPMPALLWGREAIADVVGPIVEAGHDVQLHCHAEWLECASDANPLGTTTARNVGDLAFEDQCRLIDWARDMLIAAGAPPPIAFRAGNYGASDDTLRALATLGMHYDTSHTPGIADSECRISLTRRDRRPVEHCGVVEVPTGCIRTVGGGLRHAQITAISATEMLAAIGHARDTGASSFTLVSHSFELLCRERARVNRVVRRRFEALCAGIAAMPGVASATYAADPPHPSDKHAPRPVLPPSQLRAGLRMAEQIVSNTLYGAR